MNANAESSQVAQPGGATPARIFTLTLHRHTGLLVFLRRRTYTVKGTFEQCEAAFKQAQTYNFIFGWWGVLSLLVFNWMAIARNSKAMGQLRQLAGRA